MTWVTAVIHRLLVEAFRGLRLDDSGLMSLAELNDLLEQGQGLVCRRDLIAGGVNRNWITRLVARGELEVVHPQVLSVPGLPMDVMTRCRAALMQMGPDARLCQASALEVYGVLRDHSHETIHVAVPRRVRVPSGITAHVGFHGGGAEVAGMPLVAIKQAIVESVPVIDVRQLRFPAMQAVHDRLLTASELSDLSGVPRRARKVIRMMGEEALAGAESGGEANFYRLLKDSPLPTPVLQQTVRTFRGEKRVDAYWPTYRLAAEVDGKEHHARVGDFESGPRRRNAIMAERVVVINFAVSQVMGEPNEVLLDCEANLIARAQDLGLETPWCR